MKSLLIPLLSILFFSSCVSSVSTKTVRQEGLSNSEKGKKLLTKSWHTHGMNKLKQHKSYELQLKDTWQGFLGKASSPWPEPQVEVKLKYALNSFDGQVHYLSGKKNGRIEGLQSWKTYSLNANSNAIFNDKENKKIKFILPAIQYFVELPHRLLSAELITYAGTKTFEGEKYDLVLATWNKLKAHKQNDQYLVWINQKTKLIEHCQFTIHENFSSRFFTGSISYKDFKKVDGILIPLNMYLFSGSPKKDLSKNLHHIKIKSFEFDWFDLNVLYPDANLKKLGDTK